MRTTINLDPDILHALRSLAQRERTTLGGIIARMTRKELKESEPPESEFGGFPTLPNRNGEAIVTPELVKQLQEDSDY